MHICGSGLKYKVLLSIKYFQNVVGKMLTILDTPKCLDYRAWLEDVHPVISRLSQRVGIISGLDTDRSQWPVKSEHFQVGWVSHGAVFQCAQQTCTNDNIFLCFVTCLRLCYSFIIFCMSAPVHQKHVWRAGTSNYIPQILWDVITFPCPWCLLLACKF